MTISVVNLGTASNTTGATLPFTVPAGGVPSGALILVAVTEKSTSGTSGTLADTAGNSYSSQGFNLAALAADGRGTLFRVGACKPLVSGNTITYTKNLSTAACSMSVFYAGGIQVVADPQDSAVTASATGTTGTITVTSGTPTIAGELFVGTLFDSGSSSTGGNATFTQASGWATPFVEIKSGSGASAARINGGNRINATTGTLAYAPTYSSTAQEWALQVTGYKPDTDLSWYDPVEFDRIEDEDWLRDREPDEDWVNPYDPTFELPPSNLTQIINQVIVVSQKGRRTEDDDYWYSYGQFDSPAVADISEQIWIVIPEEDIREEYDDDYIYRSDDLVFDTDHIIFVEAFDDDPPHEDDHWIYRLDDLEFAVDEITTVIDHEERIDEDDDFIYRLDDQVYDTDQVVVIIDHEERIDDEDDFFIPKLFDEIVFDDVYVVTDHDLDPDQEDDHLIYRLEDSPVAASDNEQIIVIFLDDDAKEEYDEEYIYRLDDQVYDVDQITTIVDHEEEIHVDDDYIYRLDDQVYDVDQVGFVEAFDERIDDEDDFVLSRLDDLVFDTDQVVFIPDEQVKEPEDYEDDTFDPFTDFATTAVTGNEQIVYISEYDEYFDWDPEDDLYDAYGNFDTPTVIIITDIHAKPFLSTMGRMGALGGFS